MGAFARYGARTGQEESSPVDDWGSWSEYCRSRRHYGCDDCVGSIYMGACTRNKAVGTSIFAAAGDRYYPPKSMVDDAL